MTNQPSPEQTESTLTCVYCGQPYPPGTPSHGASVLTQHILRCDKHPMRKLRVALAELVGASTLGDLASMEAMLRTIPTPDEDKRAMLNAVHALRETAID